MKVLIINGSPKGERSDTLRVTRAFVEGMGETPEIIEVRKKNVKPCLGCFSCWNATAGRCVQKDDMQEILPQIVGSDLVIWSLPLYCYGMPSAVKAVVDRLLPLGTAQQYVGDDGRTHHPAREERRARMMLISGCGFPDREGNFDGLIFAFKRQFGEHCPMILCLESPMMNIDEAAPLTDKYLETAREAGKAFAETGSIPEGLQAKLNAPMMPPDAYRAMCNSSWEGEPEV